MQFLIDILKLLDKLLSFLSAGVHFTGKEFILSCFVLLHHVLDVLHFVLKLVNHATNFLPVGTLLAKDVTHRGTFIVRTVDLLLKHGVFLALKIFESIFHVLIEVLLKLCIFFFAPVLELVFLLFSVIFSLLLLHFFVANFLGFAILEATHITLSISHQVSFFTLDNAFVGAQHALEFCDLVVKELLLEVIITGISIIVFIIGEKLVLVGVFAAHEFLDLDKVFLESVFKVFNLRQLQVLCLLALFLASAEFFGVRVHLKI